MNNMTDLDHDNQSMNPSSTHRSEMANKDYGKASQMEKDIEGKTLKSSSPRHGHSIPAHSVRYKEAKTLPESSDNGHLTALRLDQCDRMPPTTFPQRLMMILSDEKFNDIIRWLHHGQGFVVFEKKRFANEVMPKYFSNSTKYTSFTRKLSRWNFTRITSGFEQGAYYHPMFLRDNPDLCRQMQMQGTGTKQTGSSAAGSGSHSSSLSLEAKVAATSNATSITMGFNVREETNVETFATGQGDEVTFPKGTKESSRDDSLLGIRNFFSITPSPAPSVPLGDSSEVVHWPSRGYDDSIAQITDFLSSTNSVEKVRKGSIATGRQQQNEMKAVTNRNLAESTRFSPPILPRPSSSLHPQPAVSNVIGCRRYDAIQRNTKRGEKRRRQDKEDPLILYTPSTSGSSSSGSGSSDNDFCDTQENKVEFRIQQEDNLSLSPARQNEVHQKQEEEVDSLLLAEQELLLLKQQSCIQQQQQISPPTFQKRRQDERKGFAVALSSMAAPDLSIATTTSNTRKNGRESSSDVSMIGRSFLPENLPMTHHNMQATANNTSLYSRQNKFNLETLCSDSSRLSSQNASNLPSMSRMNAFPFLGGVVVEESKSRAAKKDEKNSTGETKCYS